MPGQPTLIPVSGEDFKSASISAPPEVPKKQPVDLGRYVGIFWNTYIVFEKGPELLWIDQHAAHERVRFEKLKASVFHDHEIPKQELLFPEAVKLKAETLNEITPFLEKLKTLGFEAETFGRETLMFRSVPAAWGKNQLGLRLRNFLEKLMSEEQQLLTDDPRWDQVLFERLASEACHSAIRAGDSLHAEDVRGLVEQLFECETPWNCPHGRPTTYRISEGKVEEWFQRRI
jgi:DNA mismatch repair protein MutL